MRNVGNALPGQVNSGSVNQSQKPEDSDIQSQVSDQSVKVEGVSSAIVKSSSDSDNVSGTIRQVSKSATGPDNLWSPTSIPSHKNQRSFAQIKPLAPSLKDFSLEELSTEIDLKKFLKETGRLDLDAVDAKTDHAFSESPDLELATQLTTDRNRNRRASVHNLENANEKHPEIIRGTQRVMLDNKTVKNTGNSNKCEVKPENSPSQQQETSFTNPELSIVEPYRSTAGNTPRLSLNQPHVLFKPTAQQAEINRKIKVEGQTVSTKQGTQGPCCCFL